MKKDETAYLAPDNTIFKAPLRDSLELSPFPNPHLPLLGAWLHDLDLLQIDQIICFMLIIQFTCDTVAGGVICSWITDTSLKGQQFALNSCKVHAKDSFCCLDEDSSKAEAVLFDTSDMEASLRNMPEASDNHLMNLRGWEAMTRRDGTIWWQCHQNGLRSVYREELLVGEDL